MREGLNVKVVELDGEELLMVGHRLENELNIRASQGRSRCQKLGLGDNLGQGMGSNVQAPLGCQSEYLNAEPPLELSMPQNAGVDSCSS